MAIPGLTPMWNSEMDVAPVPIPEPQKAQTEGLERQDNERNVNREQHMCRMEATVHVEEQISETELGIQTADELSRTVESTRPERRIRPLSSDTLSET